MADYLWIVILAFPVCLFSQTEKANTVKGHVIMTKCQNSLRIGNGYNKDGTEVMHSNSPMAKEENNVIVSLHPLTFKPELEPTPDAYITQHEQTFLPHTLPVVVGSNVSFLNEDEFFHNVKSYTPKSKFSIGRRAPGVAYSVSIDKTGIIDLTCDIHPHMRARIISFDTPYFTRVDPSGHYELIGIPDGQYKVEVNHPSCNKLVKVVEIKGNSELELNFTYETKP